MVIVPSSSSSKIVACMVERRQPSTMTPGWRLSSYMRFQSAQNFSEGAFSPLSNSMYS